MTATLRVAASDGSDSEGGTARDGRAAYAVAIEAAALFAVDPGLGLWLRARPGPVRDRFLADLKALLPRGSTVLRLPAGVGAAALTGTRTSFSALATGERKNVDDGLLARANGGVIVAPMAERLGPETLGPLLTAMDRGEIADAQEPAVEARAARFGLLAMDEAASEDEALPHGLADRLGLLVDLDGADPRQHGGSPYTPEAIAFARRAASRVEEDGASSVLCEAAGAYGIVSLRAVQHALRAARAQSALLGEASVTRPAVEMAVRHCLAPRAVTIPEMGDSTNETTDVEPDDANQDQPSEQAPQGEASEEASQVEAESRDEETSGATPPAPDDATSRFEAGDMPEQGEAGETTLDASNAHLPADLLCHLARLAQPGGATHGSGRSGSTFASGRQGRIVGVRRGDWRRGRVDVSATLLAAAPWQRFRKVTGSDRRIAVLPGDIRIQRHKSRRETATIFAVDASGSAALARMAETKGAVEIILSECYVRRDRVALVAFRGTRAERLLPETRSLTRARRALASLPAGGGTPLAAGLDEALLCARLAMREGRTPLIALLTDGRANIARDGTAGRAAAADDARAAAHAVRAAGIAGLVIDTASRAGPAARMIAGAMDASYLALPRADARTISAAVGAAEREARSEAASSGAGAS